MFEIIHYLNNKYDFLEIIAKGRMFSSFYISPKLSLINSPPIACNKVAYKTMKLTLKNLYGILDLKNKKLVG